MIFRATFDVLVDRANQTLDAAGYRERVTDEETPIEKLSLFDLDRLLYRLIPYDAEGAVPATPKERDAVRAVMLVYLAMEKNDAHTP